MESINEMWDLVCQEMKRVEGEVIFNVWLKPLKILSFEGTKAEIAAGGFVRSMIEKRFCNTIRDAFKTVLGLDVEIVLTDPAVVPETATPAGEPMVESYADYTFDTFVVGSSNRFAHAAAKTVAENPGVAYNPLFIYGNSGLGKTHLLCAISHEIKRRDPNADVIFTRGEDFVNLIIEGINKNRMNEIHEKYRNCDALLVDDIQFIAGKQSTQEEFFHTFNALVDARKQIVLTADRPPQEISDLVDRLRGRFESGLMSDIQPPEFETRVVIVQRKARALGLDLPEEVADYIAEHIKSNIRQLEGAVNKLNALANIEKVPVTLPMVKRALRELMSDSRPISSVVNRMIRETARTFGVQESDILSKKQNARVARARHVAIYAIHEHTGLTQKEIGEFFGRDRTTVFHSLDYINRQIDRDPSIQRMVDAIIKNSEEN